MRNFIWSLLVRRCEKICSSLYLVLFSSSPTLLLERFHHVLRVANFKLGRIFDPHLGNLCIRPVGFICWRCRSLPCRYGVIDASISHRYSLLHTLLRWRCLSCLSLLAVVVGSFFYTKAIEAHISLAWCAVLQFKVILTSSNQLFRLACLERTMFFVLVYELFHSVLFTGTASVCFLSKVTFHAELTVEILASFKLLKSFGSPS